MENTVEPTYRFYGFGNYYLSSLQQGLQAGHTVAELFVQHDKSSEKYNYVDNWARNHKTMVLLNGGNSLFLKELFTLFQNWETLGMPYPYACFHEDEQSLNGALTYVGIVLPNEIYDLAYQVRSGLVSQDDFSTQHSLWKVELINRLNSYSLAH